METSRTPPRDLCALYCYICGGFITITMSYHINEKLLKMLFKASRRATRSIATARAAVR